MLWGSSPHAALEHGHIPHTPKGAKYLWCLTYGPAAFPLWSDTWSYIWSVKQGVCQSAAASTSVHGAEELQQKCARCGPNGEKRQAGASVKISWLVHEIWQTGKREANVGQDCYQVWETAGVEKSPNNHWHSYGMWRPIQMKRDKMDRL